MIRLRSSNRGKKRDGYCVGNYAEDAIDRKELILAYVEDSTRCGWIDFVVDIRVA